MPQTKVIKKSDKETPITDIDATFICKKCKTALVTVYIREIEYPDKNKIGKTITIGWLCLKCQDFTSTLPPQKRLILVLRTVTTQPGSVLKRVLLSFWWVAKLTFKGLKRTLKRDL